ncbi:MAG: substrate-binding domain-containing protein [Spirochaetales bacterium]|jgi:LacI family transcriptional regulator|nr:substrate-binding domain-containing protein [Spirochaetales bacterium]
MTLAEIARNAGLSIGTVDRVVHNRGKVSALAREKIEAVIAAHGYTPNVAARQLKRNAVLRVGVLLPEPGSGSGYWDKIIKGIYNAASTFKPFNIEIKSAFFNRERPGEMLKAGEALLQNNVDGIILSPIVPDETQILAEKMQDIPYIYVDTPLSFTKPLVTIAQSPYRAGVCAGRMMKLLKGSGLFLTLRMFNHGYNLWERVRGFTDYFANDHNVAVLDGLYDNSISGSLYSYLDKLFLEHKHIDGIFVPHAEGHLTASYLVEEGKKNGTTLIGFDNLPLNRRALLDGAIDCLISQRADNQGFEALRTLYRKCVLCQTCDDVIEIPIDVYFRENI